MTTHGQGLLEPVEKIYGFGRYSLIGLQPVVG